MARPLLSCHLLCQCLRLDLCTVVVDYQKFCLAGAGNLDLPVQSAAFLVRFSFWIIGMSLQDDELVLIQKGKKVGDPWVITVNCPDKMGLGCDVCRTVLDFGLYISKGDVSTDGIWCYIILWVVPRSSFVVRWLNLKDRLLAVCPSCPLSVYFNQQLTCSTSSPWYLLKFLCLSRKGLLHDVTHVLCELQFTIQRVKVMTTPDGSVLDLFFITDNMECLHRKERQDGTCKQLLAVLGESCMTCEITLAGPEYECHHHISTLSPAVAEELFKRELSDDEPRSQDLSLDVKKLKKTTVTIDNSLSPAHTLLQIHCIDHKGLFYDILRTLKDYNFQIAYGRFLPNIKGYRDIDLFIQLKDGKKIVDPVKQSALCSQLKMEMLHPWRVIVANRGPDIELLVANPVELSGNGRPRVFYDVTLALKMLGICIFSAEIGRHSASGCEWEVYRFLLDENCEFQSMNTKTRNQIADRVSRTLMGGGE